MKNNLFSEKNINKIGQIYDKIFLSDGWGNSK
jgi:hypothetical protein